MTLDLPLEQILAGTRFAGATSTPLDKTAVSHIFKLQRKRPVGVLKVYLKDPSPDRCDEDTYITTDTDSESVMYTTQQPDNESFLNETYALDVIRHERVPKTYSRGEIQTNNGSAPYIIMKHLAGKTINEIVKKSGPLKPHRVAVLAQGLCEVLDEIHRVKIIHKDIKPNNILVTRKGPAIIDFGLSKLAETQKETKDIVHGTPQYLSPEQAYGKILGQQSDIYSLGATLYYMLTGRPPFNTNSAIGVCVAHIRDPVPQGPLASIPEPLKRIVLRCLEKDPQARYPSALELKEELRTADAKPFKATYVQVTQ